tara:strand:- start:18790 stop:18984 length:195 start_codon:yes stop_codon:yes gene_type:complete
MLNKVTKKECLDAIEYLWAEGYSQEMSTDKRHYTEILLKKVANDYNIELVISVSSVDDGNLPHM